MSDTPTTPVAEHYLSTRREPTIRAIWRFRELLLSLVSRDFKVKYQRSVLGLLWTLVNPILMVLVFVAVFNSILQIRIEGFWAFLISGIFAWRFASQSLNRATTILRSNAAIRRSVAFPIEIVVLSTMLATFFEFLLEIAIVMLALVIFYHQAVPSTMILLPYVILLQLLITAGLMFPLSVLSVLYYDVEHALPVVIQLLFYLTPIFYSVAMIPEVLRPYFYLNPYAGLLQLFHMILYEGVWPPVELLGLVSATAVGVFVVGYWIFNRAKDVCVEVA